MKTLKNLLLIALVLISFTSCFKDEEYTPSCIEFDKISQDFNILETKVFTSKTIDFEISNICPYIIRVTEIKIEGSGSNNFETKNIAVGTELTEDKLKFNVIFSPKTLGDKNAVLTIHHDFGSLVIHLTGTGI